MDSRGCRYEKELGLLTSTSEHRELGKGGWGDMQDGKQLLGFVKIRSGRQYFRMKPAM